MMAASMRARWLAGQSRFSPEGASTTGGGCPREIAVPVMDEDSSRRAHRAMTFTMALALGAALAGGSAVSAATSASSPGTRPNARHRGRASAAAGRCVCEPVRAARPRTAGFAAAVGCGVAVALAFRALGPRRMGVRESRPANVRGWSQQPPPPKVMLLRVWVTCGCSSERGFGRTAVRVGTTPTATASRLTWRRCLPRSLKQPSWRQWVRAARGWAVVVQQDDHQS